MNEVELFSNFQSEFPELLPTDRVMEDEPNLEDGTDIIMQEIFPLTSNMDELNSANAVDLDIVQELLTSSGALEDQRSSSVLKELNLRHFVIIFYEKVEYPGKVISVNDEGAVIECMKKGNKFWRWPKQKDIM
ncbi:unnamed protein product [Brassicogethes aeneus]|uniref:Uncharacterized protein n=1 Tax=Brassicogethes aeneus TaxID=1431903 RepID=A0A9P0BAD0_BRAAE|nr:unnamed protein product [Brassicogethes aeneus]